MVLAWLTDADGHAFDDVLLDAEGQTLRGEANAFYGWLGNPRPPLAKTDRHPYARGDAVGELVKGKRRVKADHAPGHELRGVGERMVGIERRIGELIEATAELQNKALLLHAAVAAVMPSAMNSERRSIPCSLSRATAPCRAHFPICGPANPLTRSRRLTSSRKPPDRSDG